VALLLLLLLLMMIRYEVVVTFNSLMVLLQ